MFLPNKMKGYQKVEKKAEKTEKYGQPGGYGFTTQEDNDTGATIPSGGYGGGENNPYPQKQGSSFNAAVGPSYDGIEYDYRVPNGVVVASPGGVSSSMHHYSKGFYGVGGASSDIFGHDQPKYFQGVYGNLYERGDAASTKQGYYNGDFPGTYSHLWENKTVIDDSFEPIGNLDTGALQNIRGGDGGTEPGLVVENFESTGSGTGSGKSYKLKNTFIVFMIVVIASVAIALWSAAGMTFIKTYFNKGKDLRYQEYAVYAVAFTAILVIIYWITGDSVALIQTV